MSTVGDLIRATSEKDVLAFLEQPRFRVLRRMTRSRAHVAWFADAMRWETLEDVEAWQSTINALCTDDAGIDAMADMICPRLNFELPGFGRNLPMLHKMLFDLTQTPGFPVRLAPMLHIETIDAFYMMLSMAQAQEIAATAPAHWNPRRGERKDCEKFQMDGRGWLSRWDIANISMLECDYRAYSEPGWPEDKIIGAHSVLLTATEDVRGEVKWWWVDLEARQMLPITYLLFGGYYATKSIEIALIR